MFGSLMGDFEDDPFFGHHMRSMRQMNNMMSSMFGDPFGAFDAMNALTGGFPQPNHPQQQLQPAFSGGMMPFGFPPMPNMNRLLSGDGMDPGASFCSSSVISMSHGPDGRPQVYQASSSTRNGPGGLRETQRTVQDSRSGVKKMAIGHHIGERGHIIEREQNVRSGQQEERQDFINLDEDEAEDFNREFTTKSRQAMQLGITDVTGTSSGSRRQLPAIMAADNNATSTSTNTEGAQPEITMPPSPPPTSSTAGSHVRRGQRNDKHNRYKKAQTTANLATPRRPLHTPTSSPLTINSGLSNFMSPRISIHPHPYNNVSPQSRRTHSRQMRDTARTQHVSQPQHHVQIEELPDDYDDGAPSNAPQ